MATIREISKARLVIALMYSDKSIFEEVKEILIDNFGEIEFTSEEYDFNFTGYYENEFGKSLKKIFIIFKKPINREELVGIRLYTQELEDKFTDDNKRKVNIDPGYITRDNLIMASLKEQPYKIYLGKGVFAHMIFMFKRNGIISFKHSFPDYLAQKDFFIMVRKSL